MSNEMGKLTAMLLGAASLLLVWALLVDWRARARAKLASLLAEFWSTPARTESARVASWLKGCPLTVSVCALAARTTTRSKLCLQSQLGHLIQTDYRWAIETASRRWYV